MNVSDGRQPAVVAPALTLREALTESEECAQSSTCAILRPEEVLSCSRPVGRPLVDFFPSLAEQTSPPAYVACLRNGELWADDFRSVLVGRGDAVLTDISPGYHEDISDAWIRTLAALEPGYFSGALAPVTLRPSWSSSYYHWMFEALPRLQLLQESAWAVDVFAIHGASEPFHNETLDAIGIGAERVMRLQSTARIEVERLIVTPVLPATAPQWVCEFLRNTFLPLDPGHRRVRIYVSRASATRGRRVENEAEVIAALSSRGFVATDLEGMSVREQADLFASAQCVIAPHGGALTNLVFCAPGATVIELFAPTYVHPLYWMVSNRRDLRYHYFVGRGETRPVWDEWSATGGLDSLQIDVAGLVAFMEEIGIG